MPRSVTTRRASGLATGRRLVFGLREGGLRWLALKVAGRVSRHDLQEVGLVVVRQFDHWGVDGEYRVPVPGDVITTFEKPVAGPA